MKSASKHLYFNHNSFSGFYKSPQWEINYFIVAKKISVLHNTGKTVFYCLKTESDSRSQNIVKLDFTNQ